MQSQQVFHLAVIVLYLFVFLEASLNKILGRSVPDWFREQFQDSWLARIVPVAMLFWSVALFELFVAIIFLGGLVQLEFLHQSVEWTQWGCLGAMFLFAGLCLGQRITFDFVGAANSFFYGSFSGILWYILQQIYTKG